MDCKRIFKMRDVYMPLTKRKLATEERERRVTEAMFLCKQEGIGSGAQVEVLDLFESLGSSSKLTGQKAEYMGIDADRWVDVVVPACEVLFWLLQFSQSSRKQGHQLCVR